MIANINLRNDIASLPVYFSQVREDPCLDYEILSSLNKPAKVLMIASGGDTLCHLSSHPSVSEIDAVDANDAQLNICRFKRTLLKFSVENRLRILGHESMDKNIRWQIVREICREMKIDTASFGPQELLFEDGLDFCGRYEQLFKGIQKEIKTCGLSAHELYDKKEVIQDIFCRYFDLNLLVEIFGKEATQNPLQEFHQHFYSQLQSFLKNEDALYSPFLNQMLFGSFVLKPYAWYGQLTLKQSDLCDVNFHQSMMLDFLINSKDASYDFIHLSNILDWLSEDEASILLDNTYRVLKRGGKVIIRQLNSSLDIPGLTEKLKWDYTESKRLLEYDQSFFYRNVLLGVRSCG